MAPRKPSLLETHPDLAAQWHSDNTKTPDEVTAGAKYRAQWECPTDGYVWTALVCNRALNGTGCPLCSNRVVVAGINDLASKFPDLAKEWHPDNDKAPTEVSPGSSYRAKWVCHSGHVWNIPVCNRTGGNFSNGCPVCAGKAVASGVNDLASQHPELAKEWSPRNALSADEVSAGSHKKFEWVCAAGHIWEATVASRVKQGVGCGKCSGRHVDEGKTDLATLHPELVAQWSPENPKPASAYRPGSNYAASWVCAEGHPWKTSIANRTKQGTGCPVCGNKEVMQGVNDLATVRPDLAAQWGSGNTKTPAEVVSGSMYSAEWVCLKGHTWKALVSSRAKGNGCPYCSGRKAILGVTDIATTHPHLLAEWSPTNTFGLDGVSSGSDARGEWVCSAKGHTWVTQIKHRAIGGQGCPECARTNFSSKGEKELANFIRGLLPGEVILTTHRGITGAGEVDIYIPSMSLAFEFNGVYFHSDALGRDKLSHYNKFRACERAGVRLVVVWEDDWRDRRTVVEKMVAAKLRVSPRHIVGARSLIVDEGVPAVEATNFLSREHIQGSIRAARYFGLRDSHGDLCAVAAVSYRNGYAELSRYASVAPIPGAFPRLMAKVRRAARDHGAKAILTYSDNSVSDGKLYESNGFSRAGDVPPKYGVVWKSSRHHVSSLRRERFITDPDLKYVEGVRVIDLYAINNMHRYWDYGKVRWELAL